MNIEFLELVKLELNETFEYYEYQEPKIGYRFIKAVANLHRKPNYLVDRLAR